MAAASKYETTADAVLAAVGGPGNVESVTHCATRLRFRLKDAAAADRARVEQAPGLPHGLLGGPRVPDGGRPVARGGPGAALRHRVGGLVEEQRGLVGVARDRRQGAGGVPGGQN